MFSGLIGSITPHYKGASQPREQPRGVFGLITGMFAPSNPTYAIAPPPELAPSSPLGDGGISGLGGMEAAPVEAPALQGKRITIIVKPGPGTGVEEVVQFLQDRCLDD